MAHECPNYLCLVCVGAVPAPPPLPQEPPPLEDDGEPFSLRRLQADMSVAVCNACGKKFVCARWDARNRIDQHMQVHALETPWRCFVCNAGFKRKFGLQRHLKTHVNGQRRRRSGLSNAALAPYAILRE